ncbi:MAG: FAD-binding protein [Steroidobacteraceae bacterium]
MVIGAGAGGMTAAMTAARLGVHTVVLEGSPYLFRTQRTCSTRWLDPTQYDWPMEHWAAGHFPFPGLFMPWPWSADWAHQVRSTWLTSVQQFLMHGGSARLALEYSAQLNRATCPRGAPTIQVHYVARNTPVLGSFGAMLVSVGFGTENIQVSSYKGFGFWETDPLGTPTAESPEVLRRAC